MKSNLSTRENSVHLCKGASDICTRGGSGWVSGALALSSLCALYSAHQPTQRSNLGLEGHIHGMRAGARVEGNRTTEAASCCPRNPEPGTREPCMEDARDGRAENKWAGKGAVERLPHCESATHQNASRGFIIGAHLSHSPRTSRRTTGSVPAVSLQAVLSVLEGGTWLCWRDEGVQRWVGSLRLMRCKRLGRRRRI